MQPDSSTTSPSPSRLEWVHPQQLVNCRQCKAFVVCVNAVGCQTCRSRSTLYCSPVCREAHLATHRVACIHFRDLVEFLQTGPRTTVQQWLVAFRAKAQSQPNLPLALLYIELAFTTARKAELEEEMIKCLFMKAKRLCGWDMSYEPVSTYEYLLHFLRARGGSTQEVARYLPEEQDELLKMLKTRLLVHGRFSTAAEMWSLAMIRRPEGSAEYADAVAAEGALQDFLGIFSQAEACNETALRIRKRHFGTESLQYAQTLRCMGSVALHRGNFTLAESHLLQARQILETLEPGAVNLTNLTLVLYWLSAVEFGRRNYAQQERYLQSAVEIEGRMNNPKLWMKEKAQFDRGLVHLEHDRFEQAEELIVPYIQYCRGSFGPTAYPCARGMVKLAVLKTAVGLYSEAEVLFHSAFRIYEQTCGTSNEHYSSHLQRWGLLYLEQGRLDQAEAILTTALQHTAQTFGEGYRQAHVLDLLGTLAFNKGDRSSASNYYKMARDMFESDHGNPDNHVLNEPFHFFKEL